MGSQQNIDNLFAMFHDFQIVKLEYVKNKLSLTIKTPWGRLWNDVDFQIKLEMSGCDFVKCVYGEIIQTYDNSAMTTVNRKSADKTTTDPLIISNLLLEVQRHNSFDKNVYEFICNSSNKKCSGGELTFTATDIHILDMHNQEISFIQMGIWFSEFWKDDEAK
jgi:hypothetical protein